MKIFVVGNVDVEEDSLPIRLTPKLRISFPDIEFIEWDPTENVPEDDPLILIDTVKGVGGVHVFKNLDEFEKFKPVSLHGYDVLFELKLQQKLGNLKRVVIVGVGSKLEEKDLIAKLESISHPN